ncbi:type I-E CRISPR-associated protein Cas7/Cse4/CasC [Glycomyces sp. A-F 0318]|uniref:type I-E CRISPR-associated protein Cas7/Cse4/CasC n=1 Tax=Glycomyces amatae TaxID=2881355 RepID=UPI001E56B090|nr:type I-E CRISPR-associated protein Cas7/Cse4/CasC [Glycomyces amatae]MCD0444219.1 type I-E CRISPR-associated protein Cas7/Cse4/CasC [Glycomyces amatae]
MSQPRFLDFHALQTLPFSNPNRDEEGNPKTVVFGGAERTRISSQSWKRRIRLDVEAKLGDPAVRTRRVVRGVAERLHQAHDWPLEEAEAAGRQVARSAGNGIKLEKSKDEKNEEILTTSVLLFLPEAGLDELTAIAAAHRDAIVDEEAKPEKKRKGILPSDQIAAVLGSRNGTINLFGRMLAELPGANVDGAVQMAHAFTVHETTPEFDFFSAVDDIEQQAGIPGSGHISTALFTAGTFYRYANIDLDGLVRNLGGDRTAAAELVTAFAQAFIRTVPTGKDRPTAPMTVPDLVHLAVRNDRPVSLAAAFERPIRALDEGHVAQAADRLDSYAGRLHRLLGSDRQLWAGHAHVLDQTPANLGGAHESFDDLIQAAVTCAWVQE